jgi:putative phosphoesterase
MPRLGLISDIHGDIQALEWVWAHLQNLGADAIVCAGDLVGYGPDPDLVVAFLNARQIPSVRGNHDRWALERGPGVPDDFGGGTPSRETLESLDALPFDLRIEGGGRRGYVVHGSPRDDMEFVSRPSYTTRRLRDDLEELDCDLLVVGHTHQPMWFRGEEGLVVNPGSVIALPDRVSTSGTFALLELETLIVTFHDVETGAVVDVPPWIEADDPS